MRIVLILPSTPAFLPYVAKFTCVLERIDEVEVDLISWDRLGIGTPGSFVYSDRKSQHQRGLLDYYRYSRFVKRVLKRGNYEKVIVFGLPMAFFLRRRLIDGYPKRFVLDVRDYHGLCKFFDFDRIVRLSEFTSISSPAYKSWLPRNREYLISHNMNYGEEVSRSLVQASEWPPQIVFSCIGALKDLEINRKLIDVTKNHPRIVLKFCGDGLINDDLRRYADQVDASSISVSGRYLKSEEAQLYEQAAAINMLMSPGSLNNQTCLPNRLYNAAIHARPLIALKGSYLAEVIQSFELGIVVSNVDEVPDALESLRDSFDWKAFETGRHRFMSCVEVEDRCFERRLRAFAGARDGRGPRLL